MDSKKRVLRTISRQQTDRIPMDITYTSAQTLSRLKEYLKICGDMELLRYLGADTDRIKPLDLKKNTKYNNPHNPSQTNLYTVRPQIPSLNLIPLSYLITRRPDITLEAVSFGGFLFCKSKKPPFEMVVANFLS